MKSGKWLVRPAGGQIEGGTWEVGIYKNGPNAVARTRMAWRGMESTLKSMKTASRTGTLGERMGGDNLDNSGQLFARCAA